MPSNRDYMIDPRLRRHAMRSRIAPLAEKKAAALPAFIEVTDRSTAQWLKKQPWIRDLVHLVDGYYTAKILGEKHLNELKTHRGIVEVEGVRYLQPRLHESVDSIQGWKTASPRDKPPPGAGVVIGIVDYGLDFTLKDFLDANGKTRVAYLWDQEREARGGKRPPAKYKYGVEHTASQINNALRTSDPLKTLEHEPLSSETNIRGHGTHVAAIAAGSGRSGDKTYPPYPEGHYVGVAPGATIVFVHLDRAKILDHIGNPRGTLANSINLAHGIAYCFEKAEELGLPCVVNLSMGFNGGGHDGNMAVEWVMDALLSKVGRAIVIAAGNEHSVHKQNYYGAKLKAGDTHEIKWDIGDQTADDNGQFVWGDPTPNEVEIWYSRNCRIDVELKAPGETRWKGPVKPGQSQSFTFNEGEEALITSDQRTAWEGDARIHIRLNPSRRRNEIRYGSWIIKLTATQVPAGEKGDVHAWIERTIPDPGRDERYLWSRFHDYRRDTAITVTTPATAHRVITVGSCGRGDPVNTSNFSGRGKTRDDREKPEVLAPGEQILSAQARAGNGVPARRALSGTSMSAPHVTGTVARLLSRQNYLFAEEIRRMLQDSAVRPAGAASWDREFTYGKVDAAAAMALLEAKIVR